MSPEKHSPEVGRPNPYCGKPPIDVLAENQPYFFFVLDSRASTGGQYSFDATDFVCGQIPTILTLGLFPDHIRGQDNKRPDPFTQKERAAGAVTMASAISTYRNRLRQEISQSYVHASPQGYVFSNRGNGMSDANTMGKSHYVRVVNTVNDSGSRLVLVWDNPRYSLEAQGRWGYSARHPKMGPQSLVNGGVPSVAGYVMQRKVRPKDMRGLVLFRYTPVLLDKVIKQLELVCGLDATKVLPLYDGMTGDLLWPTHIRYDEIRQEIGRIESPSEPRQDRPSLVKCG